MHRLLSASIIPIATFSINIASAVTAGLILIVFYGKIKETEGFSSASFSSLTLSYCGVHFQVHADGNMLVHTWERSGRIVGVEPLVKVAKGSCVGFLRISKYHGTLEGESRLI